MRAAEAAKNTANLIEGTVKKIMTGSSVVQKNNDEFSEVAGIVTQAGELVGEIAASSQELAQGIEHLAKAINEMDKVVQQNSATAEKNASIAQEIKAKADPMKYMISDLESLVIGRRVALLNTK